MNFVGDISHADADVLAQHARTSHCILEFGVGGSTQVIAQSLPHNGLFTSLDTDHSWIERTRSNLVSLGIEDRVLLVLTSDDGDWNKIVTESPDLVFVDGLRKLREAFFMWAFSKLKVSGKILVHDTRRRGDIEYLFRCCLANWTEIKSLELNTQNSNISVVTKRQHLGLASWHESEYRAPWESGREAPPENWINLLQSKKEAQRVVENWK